MVSCPSPMKKTVPKMSCCDTRGALYPTALGHAGLAQLVEHLICNQGVGSSSLLTGTILGIVMRVPS